MHVEKLLTIFPRSFFIYSIFVCILQKLDIYNMIKLKSSVLIGKNKKAKNNDSPPKYDNSSIIKRKVKYITTPQFKKMDLKENEKPNYTGNQQTLENVNVSVEHNNDSYECQFERLKLILKESSHCPTLTQNELRILFIKYKTDGHFEVNKNLQSLTALQDNQQNTINYRDHFYNEARHTPTVDTQYLNYSGKKDISDNLYHNNANENQQNFKYNAYEYQENCTNEMYNINEDYFPSGSANVENNSLEAHGSFESENNTFPYAQYDHFQNISENVQQYDNAMQYFDQPWNSNNYNNFHEKDCNSNMPLPNRNDNYQLWRSENSDYIPETNDSQWQYGVKNHLEQHVWNMHGPNTNYPLMNNENSDHATTINYNNHMHQDINIITSASSVATNNFHDPISFLSSFTNVIN